MSTHHGRVGEGRRADTGNGAAGAWAVNGPVFSVGRVYGAPGVNPGYDYSYKPWSYLPGSITQEQYAEMIRRQDEALAANLDAIRAARSAHPATPTPADSAKGGESMALYEVFVVDHDRHILLDGKRVVAADPDEAKFEAGVEATIREKGLKPREVTVLVREIGAVKVRPEPQKVRVIKDDPPAE